MVENLERLINYVNRKNRECNITITPKEVMSYYTDMKAINPEKAYIRTLNFIDNYIKEKQKEIK
jgi:hypothetical protein